MNPQPLRHWLAQPKPSTHRFPFDQVVDAYQHYGKPFVPEAWTALLHRARERLPEASGPRAQLAAFLDSALDKVDDRFDYRTYLALSLLPIPDPDSGAERADRLLARRDRLHVLLLCDLIAFELHALDSCTSSPMPRLRPAPLVVRKRLHHAVRAATPALRRLIVDIRVVDDPVALARRLVATACIDRTSDDRLTLRTTMLPVSDVHDEWLFIRTLQTFELTFGLLAVDLTAAVAAVGQGRLPSAGIRLSLAATLLRETAPLWSLLATMQPEAFHRFRAHTDGASAIQSRAYKLVESLCRTPDPQRLHSAAYQSVPDVRARIRAGQISLNDALTAIRADHRALTEVPVLADGMQRFTAAVHQWRRTHYRLAVRMLGTQQPGTGATPGTPYLLHGRDTAVFGSRDPGKPGNARS
ncbi:tryptophan 2,3-dioxygenase family protein [Salinispora arenicola]|uniref:tryptophan 2,3-dioxygenase family protein n=1 Tax=Salinispora arenicola TaxID=168697 RepID=UPI00037EDB50|nr:tryptophan 2,3-dioxygenase family protein [Salinispora arenicola]